MLKKNKKIKPIQHIEGMGQGVKSQKNTYCENENALASKGARYGAMSGILLFVINIIFIGPITSTEHVAPLQLHLIHTYFTV